MWIHKLFSYTLHEKLLISGRSKIHVNVTTEYAYNLARQQTMIINA